MRQCPCTQRQSEQLYMRVALKQLIILFRYENNSMMFHRQKQNMFKNEPKLCEMVNLNSIPKT
jgi:hypothetical protein